MKLLKKLLSRIRFHKAFPNYYPMGDWTFTVACNQCKNSHSDKCNDCFKGIKSGFEFNTILRPSVGADRCVVCGDIIPEGRLVCPVCNGEGKKSC